MEIMLKLFGPGCSDLKYHYLGLINVYQKTKDWTNFLAYHDKLRDWKTLRDEREDERSAESTFLTAPGTSQSIAKIVDAVINSGKPQ